MEFWDRVSILIVAEGLEACPTDQIGAQSAETCAKIAKALKPYFNEHNLFVFSTDFSHYPSYPDAQSADLAMLIKLDAPNSPRVAVRL